MEKKTIFIDTNELPRVSGAQGQLTEILNERLAGAKNVLGVLRWLKKGERFEATAAGKHQLFYLMEGEGRVTLQGKDHAVTKGMGLYLGPKESASLSTASSMKLLHLVVPPIPA